MIQNLKEAWLEFGIDLQFNIFLVDVEAKLKNEIFNQLIKCVEEFLIRFQQKNFCDEIMVFYLAHALDFSS